MRVCGIRKWIYRLLYDKPCMNRKALQIRCSLEEIQRLLGCGTCEDEKWKKQR